MKIKQLLSCLILGLIATASAAQKPNVVVFFIDDLGYADIGANGSTFYETPHIDALAKSGVNFTNAYSAHPVCSPTRASMMSGKAPQRMGITQWIHQPSDIHMPLSEVTIAEAFKEAGYKTGYIGKWHLGEKDEQMPSGQGFDWMKAVNRAGQPAHFFYPYKNNWRGGYWNVPDLEDGKKGDYLTDAITTEAMNFISDNKQKPFMLYLSHYAVHTPIQSPGHLVKKYREKRKKLYQNSETPYATGRYDKRYRTRQDDPAYAAMVENLDMNVGRVLTHLDELGLTKNTIVVFTSDNGGHQHITSNGPLNIGKGWNFEGGIRIPTIISWQGQIKKISSDLPIITMDMYPTLLDLCGLKQRPEQHLDGLSIKSVLMGKKAETKLQDRFLAWTFPHNHRGSGHKPSDAIRKGDWKLIKFKVGEQFALYNLKDDIGEKKNLAKKYPEKVKELDALLVAWLKETNKK